MKLVFYTKGIEFNGNTLNERALGGTETALIYIAKELAKLDFKVTVFNNCDKPGTYNNVEYKKFEEFDPKVETDIFIAVRFLDIFNNSINSKISLFWTEDDYNQPFLKALMEKSILSKIGKIITVSNFQTNNISNYFKIPKEKFFTTRNGVDINGFELSVNKNKNKLIYTSAPFRGLDILLDIFHLIKKEIPNAELHIFSSMKTYTLSEEEDKKSYKNIYKKANQPGVFLRGSITQKELANELLSSYLFVYPNKFPETSCIAAIEAQAAGVPIVTSKLGALTETVEQGILIEGNPYSEEYKTKFVKTVIDLLKDEDEWKRLSEIGKKSIKELYDWEMIAKEWKEEFSGLLKNAKKEKNNFEIGKDFFDKKEFNKAKEYFERYLKETPNDSSTHFYLAVAFDEQGDNEKAIFHYKKALELNPRAENAYNNLALAYIKIKDYRNAYGVLMKAVKLGHPKKKDMAELAKQIKEKIDGKISYSFSVNP